MKCIPHAAQCSAAHIVRWELGARVQRTDGALVYLVEQRCGDH